MKYSIITINYNNRDGLRKTIESVIHQTYTDFEYIVIDGGSTDGSFEVIKEYVDYIDYWVSEPDKGIYNAMNKGIIQAHGEYLNFMNSGDLFYDNQVLQACSNWLKYDIIYGNTLKEADNGKYCLLYPPQELRFMYFYEGSLNHQSVFLNSKIFKNHLYDENLKIVSDWKLFVELLIFENCSYTYVPVTIARYNGEGISSQYQQTQEERNKLLQKWLHPKIQADYERFKHKESPVLDLIPYFNKTNGFHKFIYKTMKVLVSVYSLFHHKSIL